MAPPPEIQSRTDRTLVRLSLAGQEEAGNELARRYQKPVERLIHMIVGSRQVAADLAQEAFLKAFKGLRTFQPDAQFEPWLLQIARNVATDYLRLKERDEVAIEEDFRTDPNQRVHRFAIQLVDPGMTPSTRAETKEQIAHIMDALVVLPRHYRDCFLYHVVDDLSFDEIAELTGRPASTVRQYVTRAARKVKTALKTAGLYSSNPRRRSADT